MAQRPPPSPFTVLGLFLGVPFVLVVASLFGWPWWIALAPPILGFILDMLIPPVVPGDEVGGSEP